MAISFDDAYRFMQKHGREIGNLVKRGDRIARDVYLMYRDWWNHEGQTYMKWLRSGANEAMPMRDSRRRRAVVSALEQYIQRELLLAEQRELQAKGHRIEEPVKPDAVDQKFSVDPPNNVIHMSVRRAIRGR